MSEAHNSWATVGPETREHSGTQPSLSPYVDISVSSRFWAFDLARELDAHGMLRQLFTGYPPFVASRFGLESEVFNSVLTQGPLERAFAWLHYRSIVQRRLDFPFSRRFDRIVARRLRPGANIFVGWSGQSLLALKRASALGMKTIVERGSAHIGWQRDILTEESSRTGLSVELPDPRTVDQELEEYSMADFITVPSQFVARTFVERGVPRERLIVNQFGVDLSRFQASRTVPGANGLRVIHVGRMSAEKGVQYLVPAVAKVPGATLTLVGAINPGIEGVIYQPHTRVIGPVPGGALPSFYAGADVFCLLSVQDGFAMTVTQAMAMGLPVITSSNVGAAELITDGVEGFVVPPRDPVAVADRLQRLADDASLRLEMGQRARLKVAQGFSWSDYGARARNAYTSILSSPGK